MVGRSASPVCAKPLVYTQQGGLCLVLGEPGTCKSVIKHTQVTHQPKRMIAPVVRMPHTNRLQPQNATKKSV